MKNRNDDDEDDDDFDSFDFDDDNGNDNKYDDDYNYGPSDDTGYIILVNFCFYHGLYNIDSKKVRSDDDYDEFSALMMMI